MLVMLISMLQLVQKLVSQYLFELYENVIDKH